MSLITQYDNEKTVWDESNDKSKEIVQLKRTIAELTSLLESAVAIHFCSPDFLERDFDSLDENNGKWRFMREWQTEWTTGFNTALEAFNAMQKCYVLEKENEERKL